MESPKMSSTPKAFPEIVSPSEWRQAHAAFSAKEKAFARAKDGLAAERRQLPMAKVEKHYTFEGPGGPVSLLDLFEGRPQLLLYHFMFAPHVHRWPGAR